MWMPDQPDPTEDDEGIFLSEAQLFDWHSKMQGRFPQVYAPDDNLFGEDPGQHPYGTKLMTYFDDDVNKPMRCEVMGSRWKIESEYAGMPDNREPVYIVLINGELSQIALTSAHEEGGWKVGWDTDTDTDTGRAQQNDENDDEKESGLRNSEEPISRECIECDAGCGTACPEKRCSRCHTVYYCSPLCQRHHWKIHKPDCRYLNEMRGMFVGIEKKDSGDDTVVDTNVECGICLEDHISNPVVLPGCKHVFCFSCLQEWKRFVENSPIHVRKSTCPYCRAEMPSDITGDKDRLFERAQLYAARASMKPKGSKERREYFDSALADINELLKDHEEDLQFLWSKTGILLLDSSNPAAAVDVVNKMAEIDARGRENADLLNGMLAQVQAAMAVGDEDEAERILIEVKAFKVEIGSIKVIGNPLEVPVRIAEVYQAAGEWVEAKERYTALFIKMEDDLHFGSPPLQRRVVMGMSHCIYELGKYEGAIELGSMAIEMNRHFPGVHKYVALSQKASGDLDAAIRTMTRAVLYETPWDDQNVNEARKLLNELKASAD